MKLIQEPLSRKTRKASNMASPRFRLGVEKQNAPLCPIRDSLGEFPRD